MPYSVIKRVFDLLFSAVALILVFPLLILIGIAIKLDSKGPIFYCGKRVGRKGREFRMFKFRTMVVRADMLGPSSTSETDPRITRVGRFLRKFKLDEFPQLLNVLLGQMSFVGPRPQVKWAIDQYSPEERRVLELTPGITDWASLQFSNEGYLLRNSKDPDRDYMEQIHPKKMKLCLKYYQERSFRVDAQILWMTVLKLLKMGQEQHG